jgi:phage terminase Nu1 subunit (DNA packaging protein)
MKAQREELLTRKHLAILLKVDPVTIWRYEHKGMPVMWIGHLPRYQYSKVLNWLKKQEKGGEQNDGKEQ